jgi:hypothetical protein
MVTVQIRAYLDDTQVRSYIAEYYCTGYSTMFDSSPFGGGNIPVGNPWT